MNRRSANDKRRARRDTVKRLLGICSALMEKFSSRMQVLSVPIFQPLFYRIEEKLECR